MIENMVEILLIEDNPNDVELTLHALKKSNLANHIQIARDGEEALEFIFCRGVYRGISVNLRLFPKSLVVVSEYVYGVYEWP